MLLLLLTVLMDPLPPRESATSTVDQWWDVRHDMIAGEGRRRTEDCVCGEAARAVFFHV